MSQVLDLLGQTVGREAFESFHDAGVQLRAGAPGAGRRKPPHGSGRA